MHPAYSIIVFTTLSGAGYGLAALLGLGLVDMPLPRALIGYGLAGLLITVGLVSSTFHLGHPERAWRALSQWRSSWLSREGVLAVVTFVPMAVAAIGAVYFNRQIAAAGLATAMFSALTVFSTSMIYASLRAIPAWYSPLTPICYLAFAGSTGATLFAGLVAATGPLPVWCPLLAAVLIAVSWICKFFWWRQADLPDGISTPVTATGLAEFNQIRLLDPPHTQPNYLMREMGYQVARRHAVKLRTIALVLGLAAPTALLAVGMVLPQALAAAVLLLAAVAHLAGIMVERWLFFAEARHAVTLYYGSTAV